MNKTIYSAPEVEQIQVRFEENIMSKVERLNTVNGTWDDEE